MPGPDFDDDELPQGPSLDLDLAPTSAVKPASTANLGRNVAADDWDDDAAIAAPNVDLALGADPRVSTQTSVAEAPAALKIPAPQKLEAKAIEIDAFEVKALADYGSEPKNIVESVPYAIRVLRRQRELKRATEGVRKALAEAEHKRDERLVELGTLLEPVVTATPEYRGVAEPILRAKKLVQEREAALLDTNAAFRERAGAIDKEIAALDPEREAAKAAVQAKQKAFEDADLLRQKHEARRKRVEIDVRAAQTKLDAPATPQAERTQAQAVIATANRERETRAAEEKIAVEAARKAEAELANARRAEQAVDGKVQALRGKRRDLEKEFARQGAVRSEGVEAAGKELRAGFLEIGRRAAHGGPDAPGADVRRKAVADADAQVKRLQIDLEKHVRALASADKNAVRNGLVVLGAIVFVLLASFVLWRALRSNPYLEQQPRSQALETGDRVRS